MLSSPGVYAKTEPMIANDRCSVNPKIYTASFNEPISLQFYDPDYEFPIRNLIVYPKLLPPIGADDVTQQQLASFCS